jgi:hypothetical protein
MPSQLSSKLIEFYSHTFLDLVCCCADIENQVGQEDEQSYYCTRSPTLPFQWMEESSSEDSFPDDENEPFVIETSKSILSTSCPKSFETSTTVTLRTRSYDTCSSENTLKSNNISNQGSFGWDKKTEMSGEEEGGRTYFQISLTE